MDCESLLARRSAESLERARVVARRAAHMKATFLAMRCSAGAIGIHDPLIAKTIAGRVRQPTIVHGAPTGHSTTAGPCADVTCEGWRKLERSTESAPPRAQPRRTEPFPAAHDARRRAPRNLGDARANRLERFAIGDMKKIEMNGGELRRLVGNHRFCDYVFRR